MSVIIYLILLFGGLYILRDTFDSLEGCITTIIALFVMYWIITSIFSNLIGA